MVMGFTYRRCAGGTRAYTADGVFICMTRATGKGTYEAWGNNGSKFVVSRYGSTRGSAVEAFLRAPVSV